MAKRAAHLLGIRHHGPGSAALLKSALDALDPACVLIEGPSDGDGLIANAILPGMVPPLAMLFYATDEPRNAVFYPLAEFSPEWVAMRWALERGRAVRFIDWPASVSLAVRTAVAQPADEEAGAGEDDAAEDDATEADGATAGDAEASENANTQPDQQPAPSPAEPVDPLDVLAGMAGYSDGESFWNGLIEQAGVGQDALAVFAAIETAMTEVRAQHGEASIVGRAHAVRDLTREAFMRTHIRAALKDTEGAVAAVVGAWHVGGLRDKASPSEDKAIMRALPRIKVEGTWAPWSDGRLTFASGYGAGVVSPGWYRHLWSLYSRGKLDGVEPFAAIWQATTAAALRAAGHLASTASAIEAARLALSLAGLRRLPLPGIAEMRDASLAVLCNGDEALFAVVARTLYVGTRIGEIDPDVPLMPIAKDFERWCRRTKLKPSEDETPLSLDLRTDSGLAKSTFLHRLAAIGVDWGALQAAEAGRGTFREIWTLAWQPEMTVRLAEALTWGVTIEQAAGAWTIARVDAARSVTEQAALVKDALVAGLPDAATVCIRKLQAAAVTVSDVTELIDAIIPLARVLRYGTSRKLPEEELRALISAMAVEVNAGIRFSSHQLEPEAAEARVVAMRAYDEILGHVGDPALTEEWRRQLGLIVDDDRAVAPVKGLSLRRLHEQRVMPADAVAKAFAHCVVGETPRNAGAFLAAFLQGAADILIQDTALLAVVDRWITGLDEDAFVEALPLMRRAFADFDPSSRRRILARVASGRRDTTAVPVRTGGDSAAFDRALPLLRTILGIDA